ncbi:MAG TPA: DUF5657 family protein [Candidatus Nanoarchaeia archaeon]
MTEAFAEIFTEKNLSLVIKAFQLVLLGLFIIFSLLTIRQVDIMNKALVTSIRLEVRIIGYLQLFLVLGVFVIILLR